MKALPDQPLDIDTVYGLQSADGIVMAKPVVGLGGDPQDNVIAIYVDVETNIHLLGLEPEGSWKKLETISQTVDVVSMDRVADKILDWATAKYDASELAIIAPDTSVEEEVLQLFPDRPLGKSEVLNEMNELPAFSINPLIAERDSHGIIGVLVMVDKPDGMLHTFILGYTESNGWEIINRDTGVVGVEPNIDMPAFLEWFETNHTDNFVVIDNRDRH